MQESYRDNNFTNSGERFSNFMDSAIWDKYLAATKDNMRACTEASRALSEGAQALLYRQAEVLQRNTENLTRFCKDLFSTKSPEENIEKQADFAKASVNSAIANSQDFLKIASKCNQETTDIISSMISNTISEFSSSNQKRDSNRGRANFEQHQDSKKKSNEFDAARQRNR